MKKIKHVLMAMVMGMCAVATTAYAQTLPDNLEGYLGYYPDDTGQFSRLGWYKITPDGQLHNKWNPGSQDLTSGVLRHGKLHTWNEINLTGDESVGMDYIVYDADTGVESTGERGVIDSSTGYNKFLSMCYVPDEDAVYAYAQTDYYTAGMRCEQAFCKINMSAPTSVILIKKIDSSLDKCIALAYNPEDDKFYGITRMGDFVSVDRQGNQTELFALKVNGSLAVSGLSAGLVYDTASHKLIWNALEKGSSSRDSYSSSHINTIDIATKEVAKVCTFAGHERFPFFVLTEQAVTDAVPGKPIVLSNTFTGTGSLSGCISVTLPAIYTDGNTIPSGTTLTLHTKVDDVPQADMSGHPGEILSVCFDNLSSGMHTFLFNVSAGSAVSQAASANIYVGHDEPMAPQNVRFNSLGVFWEPVTSGVNGAYFEPAAVTYNVSIDGTTVASGLTATEYGYSLPAGPASVHQAQVVAVCNNMMSQPGISNQYTGGGAMELDVHFTPTADEVLLMRTEDANHDGNSWKYSEPYMGDSYFCYQGNGAQADDWIFLPAINFDDAEKYYGFTLDARRGQNDVAEELEVYIGPEAAPNAMVYKVMDKCGPSTYNFETLSSRFTVPRAGEYYIGIHATSAPEAYFLFVNNFNVRRLHSVNGAPSPATSLEATAAPQGAPSMTVTFAMPTTYNDGSSIESSTTLKAVITTEKASVEKTGTPGQTVIADIASPEGLQTVAVQVFDGDKAGESAYAQTYVGIDWPLVVSNLTATMSADNHTINLKWEAPAEGANGGYVSPTGLTYTLVKYTTTEYGTFPVKEREIGVDVFETTYTVENPSPLATTRVGIIAANSAGESEYLAYVHLMTGTPYTLPMEETFSGSTLRYEPLTVGGDGDGYDAFWGVDQPSKYGEEYRNDADRALVATPNTGTSKGRVELPKFRTTSLFPALTFGYYASPDMPEITVLVQVYGDEVPVEVGKLAYPGTTGWTSYTINLPQEYTAQQWVAPMIDVVFSDLSQHAFIDRYVFAGTTGIDGVAADAGGDFVRAAGNGIDYAVGEEGLVLYNTAGIMVARFVSETGHICLQPGVYIAVSGGTSTKIMIR